MHEHKTNPRNIQIFSCSRIIQFKSTHTRGLPLEGGWLGCYIYLWSINFNLIASSINRGWVEPLLTIKLIIYSSSHHSHALPLVMLALVTPPSIKSTLCSLSVSQSVRSPVNPETGERKIYWHVSGSQLQRRLVKNGPTPTQCLWSPRPRDEDEEDPCDSEYQWIIILYADEASEKSCIEKEW